MPPRTPRRPEQRERENVVKSKLIMINGNQIGIVGLDEVFEDLSREGKEPDRELIPLLLEKLGRENWIPEQARQAYGLAFLREYGKYCERKSGGVEASEKAPATWQGIPREEIPWFPTVEEDLCNGCRVCLEFCPYGVFEWDEESETVRVADPYNCYVGCSTCASKCAPGAIVFPPREMLERLRKRG